MKVKVKLLSHVQLFATPWTVAQQAPPSTEFSRQECWSELPFSTPGVLPDAEIKRVSLVFPALAGKFFATRYLPRKPKSFIILDNKHISICIPPNWHLLGGSIKKHTGNPLILCCLI